DPAADGRSGPRPRPLDVAREPVLLAQPAGADRRSDVPHRGLLLDPGDVDGLAARRGPGGARHQPLRRLEEPAERPHAAGAGSGADPADRRPDAVSDPGAAPALRSV